MASVASWLAEQYGMGYATSKHAVHGLIKGAAIDHAPDLIRVHTSWVATPLLDAAIADVPEENKMEQRMKAIIAPIAGLAEPDEVADAVMFLVSQRAMHSWVTGSGSTVDGGLGIWAGSHHDV